jgi:hypothetical protein
LAGKIFIIGWKKPINKKFDLFAMKRENQTLKKESKKKAIEQEIQESEKKKQKRKNKEEKLLATREQQIHELMENEAKPLLNDETSLIIDTHNVSSINFSNVKHHSTRIEIFTKIFNDKIWDLLEEKINSYFVSITDSTFKKVYTHFLNVNVLYLI